MTPIKESDNVCYQSTWAFTVASCIPTGWPAVGPHTHAHTPAVEQGKELPSVVQVVARHPAEAEGVEVAEGDWGEHHHRSRHLVQLGDMRVLEVELHPVHAHHHQHAHGAHEEQNPQGALDTHPLDGEHVRDAVQRGPAGENFDGSRPLVVHVFRVRFEIHCDEFGCVDGAGAAFQKWLYR